MALSFQGAHARYVVRTWLYKGRDTCEWFFNALSFLTPLAGVENKKNVSRSVIAAENGTERAR